MREHGGTGLAYFSKHFIPRNKGFIFRATKCFSIRTRNIIAGKTTIGVNNIEKESHNVKSSFLKNFIITVNKIVVK